MGKKKNIYAPNKFLCFTLELLSKIIAKVFGAKFIKSKSFKKALKEGPVVVVSNHVSDFDFIYFSSAMAFHKLNFMVAENMKFVSPFFAKAINSYNAISKRQYCADVKSIKGVKSCLDDNINVLICPEGKESSDGATGVIPDSISRLLQWLKYPVCSINIKGGSLKKPKWGKTRRKGPVRIYCDTLFSKEDIKSLSKEDIYKKLRVALDNNDHLWQQENKIKSKDEHLAEGLHNLLYKCPKCGKEFVMSSNLNELKCDSCGLTLTYTEEGALIPNVDLKGFERIDLWYNWERDVVAKEVEDKNFTMSDNVTLLMENDESNGYKTVSKGVITLTYDSISYKANEDGEFSSVVFPLKEMDTICFRPGKLVEFYDEKHVYKFEFIDRLAATKYCLAVEEMYKKREK